MTLVSWPAGLILAALVIPPLILLYFLKLRRRRQPIACTLLWTRAIEDLRANAPFQRLRRSLLLLLQLVALVLLALAIMQPQVMAGERRGGRTIILIDNSASMSATDLPGGTTRLQEAKRRARERIETLYGRGLFSSDAGETMIIAFSDRAEVYSRFTGSKQQLLEAIDGIQSTHGETRIAEALALARAYTTNPDPDSDRPVGEPGTLELFSDGRIADLDEQVLRGERLLYSPIGTAEADNVAITAISMARPYDRPSAVEVFVSLANFNPSPLALDVQLSVDGTALAIEDVSIDAAGEDESTGVLVPQRSNLVFRPFEQPRGAVVEVAILREDDLEADNAARLVVPPPRQLNVALVDPDSFLVRTVLEGMTSIRRLEILTARRFETLAAEGGLDAYDVVILDDYAPPAELMVPGRYLTFGALPPIEGLNPFGEGTGQLVLDLRREHPIFRFVRLGQLYIDRFHLVEPADDVAVLAEGSESPVIVGISRGPMQVIAVTFDPLDSNWPWLRSFVTFIVNAVEHLGNVGEAISEGAFSPGEALATRLPASATDVQLLLPDGQTTSVIAPEPELFSWGPIALSGVYEVSWEQPGADERQGRLLAVNLLSDREGHLPPAPEILTRERDTDVETIAEGSDYMALWPWAVGLCLLVVMLEWWVYHRKAYI